MKAKIRNRVSYILIAISMIVFSFVYLLPFSAIQANALKGLTGIMCLFWAIIVCPKPLFRTMLSFCLILSVCMLTSMAYNGNANLLNLGWIWSYWGIALLLFYVGQSLSISRIIFYVCCAVYLLLTYTTDTVAKNETLEHGSGNVISVLCMYSLALYNFALRDKGKTELSYVPGLLILLVSAWSINRSGILCCGLYLAFILWMRFSSSSKISTTVRNILVLLICAIAIIYYLQNFSDSLINISNKFERNNLYETPRTMIWADYFDGMFDDLGNFLFGVPSNNAKYQYYFQFDGNAHNSFIVAHAKYGLLGFCVIVFYLVKSMRAMIKNHEYILLATCILLTLRCMFDWEAFPGALDVVFYYFILFGIYPNFKSQSNKAI